MTNAEKIMLEANPNALVGIDDDGEVAMIEDWADPDGRIFRLEYRCTSDGKHAVAFCRYNPWRRGKGGMNAGELYDEGHVDENGFLCLGDDHPDQNTASSPYDVRFVIPRARYWCTGFSVLKETGEFPNL